MAAPQKLNADFLATPMIAANVTSDFQESAQALFKEVEETEQEFLRWQARLLLTDVIHMTPPLDPKAGNVTTQSYSVQRKAGEAAVERDILKVFQPISALGKWLEAHTRDPKIKARIEDYAAKGNVLAVRTIVQRIMGSKAMVSDEVYPAIHAQRRVKRGRTKKGHVTFILNERQLKNYIKEVKRHVGAAKNGWAPAAAKFGLEGLPGWITGHHTPGVAVDESDHWPVPSVTLGNLVPWSGDFSELQIMKEAIAIRASSMKKDLEHRIDRAAGNFSRKAKMS